jgi:hypothetical protein
MDHPTAQKLRDVPLARIEAAVNANPSLHEWLDGAVPPGIVAGRRSRAAQRPKLERPTGRHLDDDFYRQVADAYRAAVANGLPPSKTLASDSDTPAEPSTVGSLRLVAADTFRRLRPAGERLMASSWIISRPTKSGDRRYLVRFRTGGRESTARHAGSFPTKTEAITRKRWVDGELAALRVPICTCSSVSRCGRRPWPRPPHAGGRAASTWPRTRRRGTRSS